MFNSGCIKMDLADVPQYMEGGTEIYTTMKEVDLSGNIASDVKEVVDKLQGVTSVVTNILPVAKPYELPIKAGLGVLSMILGLFAVKKAKDAKKHEARADNYSESIESAISEGSNQGIIEVDTLKTHLDKDTKAHFNASGSARL